MVRMRRSSCVGLVAGALVLVGCTGTPKQAADEGKASCSAPALAKAAHAYMVAHGEGGGTREINAHACDQGYAEILFTNSPVGLSFSYQAAMAFKAESGMWQRIGGADYIPPGSFGMPVSVGQALVKALQASAGGDEHVTF